MTRKVIRIFLLILKRKFQFQSTTKKGHRAGLEIHSAPSGAQSHVLHSLLLQSALDWRAIRLSELYRTLKYIYTKDYLCFVSHTRILFLKPLLPIVFFHRCTSS